MLAVWDKIRADLLSRRLLSGLIVLTLATAALLLTLALVTLLNLSAPYDRVFAALNGAHVWLHLDRARTRLRDVERIEKLPLVTASTGLRVSVATRATLGDTRLWVSLRALPAQPQAVNRLALVSGCAPLPDASEVLAGQELVDLANIVPGDVITVTSGDGRAVPLNVTGLAYNPIWDTYRSTQPPYLYVGQATFRRLFPDEDDWDWSLGLRLADPEGVNALLSAIEEQVRSDIIVGHTDWRNVREAAMFGVQMNGVFLGGFAFFAIVAAVLVVTTSLSATMVAQVRQIGILKALGFAPAQLWWLYSGQYLLLTLVGSTIGVALGVALAPVPLRSAAVSTAAPPRPEVYLVLAALVPGVMSAIVILAVSSSARRLAHIEPVRAMTAGAEPAHRRPAWLGERMLEGGRLPVLALGLSQLLARPLRSLLTAANLTLGVIGIVFGLTLESTVRGYRCNPALLGIAYDAVVTRELTSHRSAWHMLEQAPEVAAFYGQYLAEAHMPDGRSFRVRAVEGDLTAFEFPIVSGRTLTPGTAEALAGQGLLDWLGLEVGDTLTLVFEGRPQHTFTWRIVGQYPEPANAGQMLIVDLAALRHILTRAQPTSYYLRLAPGADVAALRRYLQRGRGAQADLDLTLVEDVIPSAVIYLEIAIFALAAILIGIALVNVFTSALLNTRERLRMIGVLKAVGMTPTQVVSMVVTGTGCLGLVACAAGIPGGLALTYALLAAVARAYGFGQLRVMLSPVSVLLVVPVVVSVGAVGGALPARWAARVPVVQALHYE